MGNSIVATVMPTAAAAPTPTSAPAATQHATDSLKQPITLVAGWAAGGCAAVHIGFDPLPFSLGFLLEPIAEINMKRTPQTNSDLSLFMTRPASGFFIVVAILSVVYYFYAAWTHMCRGSLDAI